LLDGSLSLSNAALVQSFIQMQERQEQREPVRLEEKKKLIASVQGKTHKEARQVLAKENPVAALPPCRERVLTEQHTQLQITVDQDTLAQLEEVKELLSHTVPDGNLHDVLKYMLQLTATTLKKRKGHNVVGLTEEPNKKASIRTQLPSSAQEQASVAEAATPSVAQSATDVGKRSSSRYISMQTKRIVFQRSRGCCEYIGINGKRCHSRVRLELDHVLPFSLGGKNDAASLRILCRAHNQFRNKETHGFWYEKR
jgi:hypothetical protein